MQRLSQVAKAARFAAMQPAAVAERLALAAITTHDPEQIVLQPPNGTHPWSGYHSGHSLTFTHFSDDKHQIGYFSRLHGNQYGTGWYGRIMLLDQQGRRWERNYDAVIDDFGNLVEVQ